MEAEGESVATGLWDNPKKAEAILKELKYWTQLSDRWNAIKKRRDDLEELSGMVSEENEEEHADLEKEAADLEITFQKAHIELVLNGPYDKNDAILILSSGTGGVDAQDWTEMLLRMYLRFAEKKGWKTTITEKTVASEAGIKSATIEVSGLMAYGYLKAEHGVHRLVRLSPFNAKNLRQTSFALVEVLPVIHEDEGVEIDPKDLRVDTYRSSGAGGQHVNKTDSAVRITHLPTGIVVACQNERSQIQNRARAMAVLKSKLIHLMQQEHKERLEELKGEHKEAAWSNQIRSYTFQPYTMVKDHRTKAETSQVHQVMDGDLDMFIEAYLLQSKS